MLKVSVIIPTKNSEAFIEKCLQSVVDQSYLDIEIIVVDNFSTDKTLEIAMRYTDKCYSLGPERCSQRNYGVSQANGEYVAIIDSDMELGTRVIESCVEKIRENGVIGVIIPEESFGVGYWANCKRLERRFYVGEKSLEAARFFSVSTYRELKGYNENLVSGEDWDLSDRAEELGRVVSIDAISENYIYHNEGKISLIKTLNKKFYYASKALEYLEHSKQVKGSAKRKGGIFFRYILFLSKPKLIFENPSLMLGVLLMKTLEFGVGGLGIVYFYLKSKLSQ